MRQWRSHGRPIGIWIVLIFGISLAFGSGYWLSKQNQAPKLQRVDQYRFKQVSVQTRLLADTFLEEVELLRHQALSVGMEKGFSKSTSPFLLTGKNDNLLHWMELEVQGLAVGKVKQIVRNPNWKYATLPSSPDGSPTRASPETAAVSVFEENYIRSVIQTVNPVLVSKTGIGLFRIPEGSTQHGEWLSLAFPSNKLDHSLYLILVDPQEVFKVFGRWARHSSGGLSRSYLLGSDGRVIIHSQKTWNGSGFSKTHLYQQSLKHVFGQSILSGFGDYIGVDQNAIGVAFLKVENLPLAVVVEEVNVGDMSSSLNWRFLAQVLFVALCLLGITFGIVWILQNLLVKVVTLTVREKPSTEDFSPIQTRKSEISRSASTQERYFSGNEFLVLEPVSIEDQGPEG